MANKADGEVLIVSKIDNSKAQKKLDELQQAIAKTESEIEKLSAEQKKTEEKGIFKREELEKEKALLADMRKDLAEMRSVAADTSFSESVRAETRAQIPIKQNEIAEQARKVSALQKELNQINSETRKYSANLEKAKKLLDSQETKAGELAEQLIAAKRNMSGISTAAQQAQKRMDKLSRRVKELVKSALIFSVITKGLTELKEWSVNVLKANEEARKSIAKLKAALLTLAQPLVNVLIPATVKLLDILTAAVVVLARITAAIMGTTTEEAEKNAEALNKETEAIEGVGEAAKKTGRQLASFDQINKLSGADSSGLAGAILPDFESLDFDLSHIAQELEDLVVDIEAKIKNIRFDWENGNITQNKAAWSAALTGLLGAVIGASFGGLSGGVIGLLLGALIGLSGLSFTDALVNAGETNKTLFAAIGAILGAVLGTKLAGLPGGAIGLLLGSLVGITGIKFLQNESGSWDTNDTITSVIGSILLAVLGAAVFGGLTKSLQGAGAGAAIGLMLGALITFNGIEFSDGVSGKEAALTNFRAAIGAIIGGILGFRFLGWKGAALGVLLGLAIGFGATAFDDNMSQEARRQAGEKCFTTVTTIIGAIIGYIFGGGVFGGIVGGVIGLAFGLAITFGDVDVEDLPTNGELKIDSSGKPYWTTTGSIYSIPGLATGAVIPPNRKFLAVLGDNKTENEIVSPVSAMKQAFKEAAQEMGGLNGGELTLRISEKRGLARYLKLELDAEDTRQGGKLVTNERLYT